MPSAWPVEIAPSKPIACGAVVWRMHGALRVTVVLKVGFALVHEGAARPIAPTDLVRVERRPQGGASVAEVPDLAPYLPSAGVLVSGHACAPPGGAMASTAVRLIVFREGHTALDKTLHVFGDRDATPAARPLPFLRMPLVWERTRAYGGPGIDDNPVGVGAQPGARAFPNIVDAVDPRRPAGFAPIGSRFPSRTRLLGGAEPPILERPVVEIPDGFDWRWFHAAPADQQISFLTGDEWIVLDGMHPTQPRVQSRLPQIRAEARWFREAPSGPTAPRAIDLGADTLAIDADRLLCWVVWRGHFTIESLEELPRIRVQADFELPGYPIAWPDAAPAAEARVVPVADPATPALDGDRTAMLNMREIAERALRPIAPFALAAPGARPQAAPPVIPGAPPTWMTSTSSGAPAVTVEPPPSAPAAKAEPPEEREADTAKMKAKRREEEPSGRVDDDPFERTSRLRIQDLQRPIAPFALAVPGARVETPRASIPGAPWSSQGQEPPRVRDDGADTATDEPTSEPEDPHDPRASTAPLRLADRGARAVAPFALSPVRERHDGATSPAIPGAPWGALMAAPPLSAASPSPPEPIPAPAFVVAPPAEPALVAKAIVEPPVEAPFVDEPTATELPAAAATIAEALALPAAPSAPMSELRRKVLDRLAAGAGFDDQDLSRGDLRDLDFHGRSLVRCNLRGATLSGCNFDGARLEGAQLGEADLRGASLVSADLARADLTRAKLAGARFDKARLLDAKLAGAEGQGASFRGATGQRTSFARGAWDGAIFDEIDISGADFTGARIEGASFRSADVVEIRLADAVGRDVVFDEARLPDARAKGATLLRGSFLGVDAQRSAWSKARLDGACFDGANLRGANLAGASCVGARFAAADLADAVLHDCDASSACFVEANLRGARMERLNGAGADLGRAALDGADLRSARFPRASFASAVLRKVRADQASFDGASFFCGDLTEASLRAAVLCSANLGQAILRGADLRDADLEGANVHESRREGAKMAGANLRDLRDEAEPDPRR